MEVWKGKRLRAGNVSLHLNLDVNFTTAVEGLENQKMAARLPDQTAHHEGGGGE